MGDSSADRSATELTVKYAPISNDRLIHRTPGDELSNYSIHQPKFSEFRPISLFNQIGKICERIITWFLKTEAAGRPNQHGCQQASRP
jgi:hypothetical protein